MHRIYRIYPQMTQMNAEEMMIVIHVFLSLVSSNIISQDTESQKE